VAKLQLRIAAHADTPSVEAVEPDEPGAGRDEAFAPRLLIADAQDKLGAVAKRLDINRLRQQGGRPGVPAESEARAVLARDPVAVRPELIDALEGKDRVEVRLGPLRSPANLVQEVRRPRLDRREEVRSGDKTSDHFVGRKAVLPDEFRPLKRDDLVDLPLLRPSVRQATFVRSS
jgi:hypothetical protein